MCRHVRDVPDIEHEAGLVDLLACSAEVRQQRQNTKPQPGPGLVFNASRVQSGLDVQYQLWIVEAGDITSRCTRYVFAPRERVHAPAMPNAAYGEHEEDNRDSVVEIGGACDNRVGRRGSRTCIARLV